MESCWALDCFSEMVLCDGAWWCCMTPRRAQIRKEKLFKFYALSYQKWPSQDSLLLICHNYQNSHDSGFPSNPLGLPFIHSDLLRHRRHSSHFFDDYGHMILALVLSFHILSPHSETSLMCLDLPLGWNSLNRSESCCSLLWGNVGRHININSDPGVHVRSRVTIKETFIFKLGSRDTFWGSSTVASVFRALMWRTCDAPQKTPRINLFPWRRTADAPDAVQKERFPFLSLTCCLLPSFPKLWTSCPGFSVINNL